MFVGKTVMLSQMAGNAGYDPDGYELGEDESGGAGEMELRLNVIGHLSSLGKHVLQRDATEEHDLALRHYHQHHRQHGEALLLDLSAETFTACACDS